MYKHLLIIVFSITYGVCFAQFENEHSEKSNNSIYFDLGLIHSRIIDHDYTNSNLLFRGTNLKFQLGYLRQAEKSIFDFSVALGIGKVQSKSGNLPSDFISVIPEIGYVRKIKSHELFGIESSLFAGIHLSSVNYFLANEPIIDNIDLISLHGIYFNASSRFVLSKKSSLQLTYFMPVMVYTNRILWNGGASDITYSDREHILRTLFTRGTFSYFTVFKNIQLKSDYKLTIGKSTELELKYRFFYISAFDESPIRMYSNELLMGLNLKF